MPPAWGPKWFHELVARIRSWATTRLEELQEMLRRIWPWTSVLLVAALVVGTVVLLSGASTDVAATVRFVNEHFFVVLAPLPSLVAVVLTLATRRARLQRTVGQIVAAYGKKSADADGAASTARETSAFGVESSDGELRTRLERHAPMTLPMVAASLLLAAVFLAAATVWEAPAGQPIGLGIWPKTTDESRATTATSSTTTSTTSPAAAAAPGEPSTTTTGPETTTTTLAEDSGTTPGEPTRIPGGPDAPYADGRDGLQYATIGAYVYALSVLTTRISSSMLTGTGMFILTMRVALAMVLGFIAGEVGAFNAVASGQRFFAFFLIGLSPGLAITWVRRASYRLFEADRDGCETLPLCLIDGIDDEVVDRLSEIGASDVQHVATWEPVPLIMRTMYPARRVIDWIDQAVLIAHVRHKIATFRACGIRGAINLATLYRDAVSTQTATETLEERSRRDRAKATFDLVAKKTDLSIDFLYTLGRLFSEDRHLQEVRQVWYDGLPGRRS